MRIICAWLVLVSVACGQVHFSEDDDSCIALNNITSSQIFTISFWANQENGDSCNFLDCELGRFVFLYRDSVPDYAVYAGSSFHYLGIGNAFTNDLKFWTIVKSNTSATVYLDGDLLTSFALSNVGIYGAAAISQRYTYNSAIDTLDGNIADFRIYTRALSASEIAEIYTRPWVLTDDPDLVLRTCVVTNDTGDALTGVARNYGTGADGTYSNSPTAAPWTIQMEQPQRATINID